MRLWILNRTKGKDLLLLLKCVPGALGAASYFCWHFAIPDMYRDQVTVVDYGMLRSFT